MVSRFSILEHVAKLRNSIDIYAIGAEHVFVRTENATVSIKVSVDRQGHVITHCALVPDNPFTIHSKNENNAVSFWTQHPEITALINREG